MTISSRVSALLRRHARHDWNQNAAFFQFTRGRFVCKEGEQSAQRYVKFDMNQLCRIAENAVGKECINVEKCADGMYNKAFLLTMTDNEQVVAKIPNPNAGLPHLTTASEVETMDLMRKIMQTPTPRVLAWNSNKDNSVQAEYIIMEKAKGVQLGTVWPTMSFEQKVQVLKAVGTHQKAWPNISFGRIGSLFYVKDLPSTDSADALFFDESGKPVTDSEFTIGPIVSRQWMDSGRGSLDCDRGPWTSIEAYRRAVLKRDIQAARTISEVPVPLSMLCGPSLYQPTAEKKIFACEATLQILSEILPQEQWASTFHMWHDDFHEENIFVDATDPTVITAIIDWQSTSIVPMFDHTIMPGFLDYDGPTLQGIERPEPPSLTKLTDPEERAAALKLFDEQSLACGYKFMLSHHIKPVFDALMYEESSNSRVLSASRNIFEVGAAYCLGSITELEDSQVKFSDAETATIQEDLEKTMASMNCMDAIKDNLGTLFPEKGCVRPDQYNDSKAALRRVKQQVIEDFSKSDEDRRVWEEVWPFDD